MTRTGKVVSQYNGNHLIAKYSTMSLASTLNDIQPAHIGKVANGIRVSAGGFGWRFPRTLNLSRGLSTSVRGVAQVDTLTDEIVAVYESVEVASDLTGFRLGGINLSIRNSGRTAGGFRWITL